MKAAFLSEMSPESGWSKRKWVRNMRLAFLSWFVMSQAIIVCSMVFCFSSLAKCLKCCIEFPAVTLIPEVILSNSVTASAPEFICKVEGDCFLPCVYWERVGGPCLVNFRPFRTCKETLFIFDLLLCCNSIFQLLGNQLVEEMSFRAPSCLLRTDDCSFVDWLQTVSWPFSPVCPGVLRLWHCVLQDEGCV